MESLPIWRTWHSATEEPGKLWVKLLAGVLLIIALLPVAAIYGFYYSGLSVLSALPEPPQTVEFPTPVLAATWVAFENSTPSTVESVGPLEYVAKFLMIMTSDSSGRRSLFTGSQIAHGCAELIASEQYEEPEGNLYRQLTWAALATWLSTNWTSPEIVTCVLTRSYFGRGFYGVAEAAEGYLGTTPARLSYSEAAMLLMLLKAPASYDPVCHPDRAVKRRDFLLGRIAEIGVLDPAEATRAPLIVRPELQCD